MLHMLTRLLGRHVRNSIAMRSGITDFIAQFFAAELRAWRGEQPLWKVFWLYGVATSCAMIAIYVIAFFIDRVALRQILLLCFAPYTAWILVSVWRCADNTHEWLWTLLARFLTVAWACNTIMVLVFLQINLITRYYLRY